MRKLVGTFFIAASIIPTSAVANVDRHGRIVTVMVQERYRRMQPAEAGAYDSERHIARLDCGRATIVEGHAYLYLRGRYVGVRTFEYDLDELPIAESDEIYQRLYRERCANSAKKGASLGSRPVRRGPASDRH